MTGAKPLKWLFVVILVAAGAGLFLGLRMYREDLKELKRFLAAYDRFDTAISEVALQGPGAETADVRRALSELQGYAGMKLSSLIKNDGELMAQAREIADLAQREVEGQTGRPGAGSGGLTEKRKAAFAHFLELAPPSRAPGTIAKEE